MEALGGSKSSLEQLAEQGVPEACLDWGVKLAKRVKHSGDAEKESLYLDIFSSFERGAANTEKSIPNELLVNLAFMLDYGLGCDEDKARAFLLYKLASDNDHSQVSASLKVAVMSELGIGTHQSDVEAFEYYLRACEQPLDKEIKGQVQYKLGMIYLCGWGTDQSNIDAFKCFKNSAAQGYRLGQLKYLELLEVGGGEEQDKDKAYKGYLKLAGQLRDASWDSWSREFVKTGLRYKAGTICLKNHRVDEWSGYLKDAAKYGHSEALSALRGHYHYMYLNDAPEDDYKNKRAAGLIYELGEIKKIQQKKEHQPVTASSKRVQGEVKKSETTKHLPRTAKHYYSPGYLQLAQNLPIESDLRKQLVKAAVLGTLMENIDHSIPFQQCLLAGDNPKTTCLALLFRRLSLAHSFSLHRKRAVNDDHSP